MNRALLVLVRLQLVATASAGATAYVASVPAAASRASFRVEFAVTFENGVAIDIRMTEVDPPGRIGKSVVDAATAAILRCGPYSSADAGTITLVVESEELRCA